MSLSMKNTTYSNLNSLRAEFSLNFMFLRKYKPQINADERRFMIWVFAFMDFHTLSNKIKRITKMLRGVDV